MVEGTYLKAGALSLSLIEGDLRKIAWNDIEIVNRIYVAVRDPNWGTVPGRLADLSVDSTEDGFVIRYQAEHREGDIHFVWNAEISADADGHLIFQMEGEALSSFQKNRIGICILHPASAAGDRVVVTHPDGSTTDGAFPATISPHQPFKEMSTLRHLLSNELETTMTFSGDVFEMEDQRNWTDGSFKTYSTPIELPFPVKVEKGTRIRQSVELHVHGEPRRENIETTSSDTVTVAVDSKTHGLLLPEIGFGYGTDAAGLSENARARLAELRPAFLDLTLPLHDEGWQSLLDAAVKDARSADLPLQLTLRLSERADDELKALLARLQGSSAKVQYWTILSEGAPTTTGDHLRLARKRLGGYDGGSPIGGGTRSFFAELNRNRPDFGLLDFVSFTVNPQVHATDELSIIETLAGQRATVASARAMDNDRPVHIGAVTLKLQWNPNATSAPKAADPKSLPPEVDPRQRSGFAAAWTLGSIKAFAESGAKAVTFFEVEGWKGLMETPAGSLVPDAFPSKPNEPFPLYGLFRGIAGVTANAVVSTRSTKPLEVEGLALRTPSGLRVFLANYSARDWGVSLEGVRSVEGVYQMTAEPALRSVPAHNAPEHGRSALHIAAHSVIAVDCLE